MLIVSVLETTEPSLKGVLRSRNCFPIGTTHLYQQRKITAVSRMSAGRSQTIVLLIAYCAANVKHVKHVEKAKLWQSNANHMLSEGRAKW
jgi:hypothetical protein